VKAEKFIKDCEASLVRLLDQESNKPGISWADVYLIFDNKIQQLLNTYKDHRGKILIASANVRKALDLVIKERTKI
jgi:hypothetical protein